LLFDIKAILNLVVYQEFMIGLLFHL